MFAGIRCGPWALSNCRLEAAADAPVIGGHVRKPDGQALTRAQDNMRGLWCSPLNMLNGLAVEAQLERVFGPWMSRQFCVEDLIAPRAKRGWQINTLEEVPESTPHIGHEDRLVDIRCSCLHRISSCPGSGRKIAGLAEPYLYHLLPGVPK